MPDDRTCRRAIAVSLGFVLLTGICIGIIGMTMRVLYPGLSVADAASTVFASQVLPPLVGAVVMTAVIAAIMSTVDSVLLIVGSAVSRDIYHRLINPDADERTRMRVNRWATLVVGVVPILLTLRELDIVQFVVLAFAALLASTVVVPVVVGLYWKRASAAGAITSMVAGFTTCLVWYLLGEPFTAPVVPGVAVSAVAMLVVSAFTRPVTGDKLAWFFPIRAAAESEPAQVARP
jgi:Na+/proline symporter